MPWWLRGFALDLRSLALFRIVIGFCLVGSLIRRLSEAATFYSAEGVLPAPALVQGRQHIFSLHLISDTAEIQYAIFFLAIVFAVTFTIGYRTRLSTFVSWILWVSMLARNPMVAHGGDHELKLLLFWGMFLPLNGMWSVDKPRARPLTQLSPATVALVLQVCAVYWFAAAEKMGPAWLTERSAVYYALYINSVATSLGTRLLEFPDLLRWIAVATVAVELLGPFLAISPWKTNACRVVVVLLFLMFHLGIGLAMHIGLFAYISALAWVVFLPASVWRERVDGEVRERSLIRDAVVVSWVLLVAASLIDPRVRSAQLGEKSALNYFATLFGAEQRWPMFSPRPATLNPRWIVEGITPERRRVDMWSGVTPGTAPVPWETAYRSEEWNSYMFQVLAADPVHHEALGLYFCRVANGPGWGRRTAPRLVDSVSLRLASQRTPPPGRPKGPEVLRGIWKGLCP